MPPGRIRSLEDYALWLDRVTEECGGEVEGHALLVQPVLDLVDRTTVVALRVPRQRIRFPSEHVLGVTLNVNDDLVATTYNFQFMHANGRHIWRKDKQPGHGPLEHIHRDPSDPRKAEPYDEVDLAEVCVEAWSFISNGTMP